MVTVSPDEEDSSVSNNNAEDSRQLYAAVTAAVSNEEGHGAFIRRIKGFYFKTSIFLIIGMLFAPDAIYENMVTEVNVSVKDEKVKTHAVENYISKYQFENGYEVNNDRPHSKIRCRRKLVPW